MDGKDIKKIFGANIKELRISKNLTQEKLAELVDVDTSTITRIETGINFANCETFAKLCDIFSVPPAVLLAPKPQITLKEHNDNLKAILQLLQTCSPDSLKDIYKIIFLYTKYFS